MRLCRSEPTAPRTSHGEAPPVAERGGGNVTRAIYARLSKDAEQQGLSVAGQERECRALAANEGLQVVDVYVDDDLSAYNRRRPRPAYLRLL